MDRKSLEALAFRHTHNDFKGRRADGTRVVLKLVEGAGTCSVALSSLTDAELIQKIPRRIREEKGLSPAT